MKKAIAVIGEGITEKYYIESLKGLSSFHIRPNSLDRKASSLTKLEESIQASIKDGYDEVYCLIDMDGKSEGVTKTKYLTLKQKYHNKIHGKANKGIQCKVLFIESERCTEIWFLYHFLKNSTTKKYNSYKELEKALHKYIPDYDKSERYFKSLNKGLHNLLISKGSIESAVKNSKSSLLSKAKDNRNYTFSEIHLLLKNIGII